jgi:hypothetical protein
MAAFANILASKFVMPGLVPGIHDLLPHTGKAWMAGPSPAMTNIIAIIR